MREYFLHLLNERSYAPQSMRLTRAVSGVPKPAPHHTLRHCYATHLLAAGGKLRRQNTAVPLVPWFS